MWKHVVSVFEVVLDLVDQIWKNRLFAIFHNLTSVNLSKIIFRNTCFQFKLKWIPGIRQPFQNNLTFGKIKKFQQNPINLAVKLNSQPQSNGNFSRNKKLIPNNQTLIISNTMNFHKNWIYFFKWCEVIRIVKVSENTFLCSFSYNFYHKIKTAFQSSFLYINNFFKLQ